MTSVFPCHPAEDVMMETVVEVSTECGPIEEESFPIPSECEPTAKKKRGGQCYPDAPSCLSYFRSVCMTAKALLVKLCVFVQVAGSPRHTSLRPTVPSTSGSRRGRGRAKVCLSALTPLNLHNSIVLRNENVFYY